MVSPTLEVVVAKRKQWVTHEDGTRQRHIVGSDLEDTKGVNVPTVAPEVPEVLFDGDSGLPVENSVERATEVWKQAEVLAHGLGVRPARAGGGVSAVDGPQVRALVDRLVDRENRKTVWVEAMVAKKLDDSEIEVDGQGFAYPAKLDDIDDETRNDLSISDALEMDSLPEGEPFVDPGEVWKQIAPGAATLAWSQRSRSAEHSLREVTRKAEAATALREAGRLTDDEYVAQLKTLTTEKEKLETALAEFGSEDEVREVEIRNATVEVPKLRARLEARVKVAAAERDRSGAVSHALRLEKNKTPEMQAEANRWILYNQHVERAWSEDRLFLQRIADRTGSKQPNVSEPAMPAKPRGGFLDWLRGR